MPDTPAPSCRSAETFLTARGFRAQVRPLMPKLSRYAAGLTLNRADADDLLQDTLLKAWAARESFAQGSNLKAWLMRIARNTFLSARRRAARQVLWEPDEIARALVTTSDQETGMLLEELRLAVRALPPSQQRAFEAVAVEDLSYEVAANRLGVELGTLKSQVSRARASLVRGMEASAGRCPTAGDVKVALSPVRRTAYARWKASGSRMIGGAIDMAAA